MENLTAKALTETLVLILEKEGSIEHRRRRSSLQGGIPTKFKKLQADIGKRKREVGIIASKDPSSFSDLARESKPHRHGGSGGEFVAVLNTTLGEERDEDGGSRHEEHEEREEDGGIIAWIR